MLPLLPIGIAFMNFTFFYVGGAPFTLGTIISAMFSFVLLVEMFSNMQFTKLIMVFIGATFLVLYLLVGVLYAKEVVEFIKSYVLFVNLLFVIYSTYHLKTIDTRTVTMTINVIIFTSMSVSLLVLIQYIFWNILDNFQFTSVFGVFTPSGPGGESYIPRPDAPIKRPNAVFSEPSIAGWYLSLSAAIIYLFSDKSKLIIMVIAFVLVASMLTFSLSGIFNSAVLIVLILFYAQKYVIRKIVYIPLIIMLVVLSVYFITPEYIGSRLNNLFIEGTSSYYRLVAPIMLLNDSLVEYPFGHLLGQIEYIKNKPYMVNWEHGSSTNIDNSVLMFIYYFGLFGVVALIAVIYKITMLMLNNSNSIILYIMLILLLSETGSIWSPNLTMVIGLVIILSRYIRYNELYDVATSKHNLM